MLHPRSIPDVTFGHAHDFDVLELLKSFSGTRKVISQMNIWEGTHKQIFQSNVIDKYLHVKKWDNRG